MVRWGGKRSGPVNHFDRSSSTELPQGSLSFAEALICEKGASAASVPTFEWIYSAFNDSESIVLSMKRSTST